MAGTDPKDDFTVEADADALVGDGYMDSLSKDSLKGMRIGYLDYSFCYPYAEYPEEEAGGDETGNDETGNDETGNDETGNDETGNDETGEEEDPGYIIKYRYPDAKLSAMTNRTLANLRKAGAEIVDLSDILPADVYYSYYIGATGDTMEYDLNKYLYEKGDAATYKTMKDILKSGKDISYTYLNQGIEDPNALADSFEETENPYTTEIGSFKRLDTWEKALEGRAYITEVLAENNIDAVMYLPY
jgi:Asp-tRNA(Asn)/Glu-tRNA(Gln) amidotransferase A subunit family amidase